WFGKSAAFARPECGVGAASAPDLPAPEPPDRRGATEVRTDAESELLDAEQLDDEATARPWVTGDGVDLLVAHVTDASGEPGGRIDRHGTGGGVGQHDLADAVKHDLEGIDIRARRNRHCLEADDSRLPRDAVTADEARVGFVVPTD